jgi:hypothetical protein
MQVTGSVIGCMAGDGCIARVASAIPLEESGDLWLLKNKGDLYRITMLLIVLAMGFATHANRLTTVPVGLPCSRIMFFLPNRTYSAKGQTKTCVLSCNADFLSRFACLAFSSNKRNKKKATHRSSCRDLHRFLDPKHPRCTYLAGVVSIEAIDVDFCSTDCIFTSSLVNTNLVWEINTKHTSIESYIPQFAYADMRVKLDDNRGDALQTFHPITVENDRTRQRESAREEKNMGDKVNTYDSRKLRHFIWFVSYLLGTRKKR